MPSYALFVRPVSCSLVHFFCTSIVSDIETVSEQPPQVSVLICVAASQLLVHFRVELYFS